jgi:hypothetical protein
LIIGYRLPSGRAIRVDLDEVLAMIKVVPTVRAGMLPFGPRAKIIDYHGNVAEPLPPRPEPSGQPNGSDLTEVIMGGER